MLKYTVTASSLQSREAEPELVNDTHSKLNPTLLKKRIEAKTTLELLAQVKRSAKQNEKICIAGGRHAMGGQQFKQNGVLIDMSSLNKILSFDRENGLLEVEGGIMWPDLISSLQKMQEGEKQQWSIAQKQSGCDRLSIGGAVAANVHGRGLKMAPFIQDIEELKLVNSEAEIISCKRSENRELFSLAAGGYGLFGIISSAKIRLVKKRVLKRRVELNESKNAVAVLENAAANGALYGDFQFAIDSNSSDFLQKGIISTYTPIEDIASCDLAGKRRLLSENQWKELLFLAHTNKSEAFKKYAEHYLATDGQLYHSDTFQLATYLDDYHKELDLRMPERCSGTEMISELYVPRDVLGSFLCQAAALLKEEKAELIYGTCRLIEKDYESFLAWAKEPWACTVLNLHVEHTPCGVAAAARAFCRLIDLANTFGGSFYLTYHRFAGREQLLRAYPQFPEFMAYKKLYDSQELFSSDWYEHSLKLLS